MTKAQKVLKRAMEIRFEGAKTKKTCKTVKVPKMSLKEAFRKAKLEMNSPSGVRKKKKY